MKKSLALVIGNADYRNPADRLLNAINDAADIAEKLQTVGFEVILRTDCLKATFESVVADFGTKLMDYEVGLFYYSGHGLQIDEVNYLTCIDTNFFDETSVPESAFALNRVIRYMERTNASIKILILDTCRDNPLKNRFRSSESNGLAPIHAPKGSLIAFSTSPGEKAQDYGMGRNSIYTGSLLRHIDDPMIPIEEVFKRVRTSVYAMTRGKQTSWEHTSLIGDYYFNYGQRIYFLEIPYKPEYVKDGLFQPDDSPFGRIISGLRSHTWNSQNKAMDELTQGTVRDLDENSLFLLGRNILQTAAGGSFTARNFLELLTERLSVFPSDKSQHILNGMLFEVYFDKSGQFRGEELKSKYLAELFKLENKAEFRPSFDFIWRNLRQYSDYLFYIPGGNAAGVSFEVVFGPGAPYDEPDDITGTNMIYTLTSLKYQGNELLVEHDRAKKSISFADFNKTAASWLSIPESKLTIISAFHPHKDDIVWVPRDLRLSKAVRRKEEDFI